MPRAFIGIVLLSWMALTGCSREQSLPPDTPPAEPASEAAAPPPIPAAEPAAANPRPAAATTATGAALNGVVDPNLTAQLKIFVQQRGRLPESFAEFAGARLDSVPRLGPGLMFAIDTATHEVKIVRK